MFLFLQCGFLGVSILKGLLFAIIASFEANNCVHVLVVSWRRDSSSPSKTRQAHRTAFLRPISWETYELRFSTGRYIKEASERICTCLKKAGWDVSALARLWMGCDTSISHRSEIHRDVSLPRYIRGIVRIPSTVWEWNKPSVHGSSLSTLELFGLDFGLPWLVFFLSWYTSLVGVEGQPRKGDVKKT